VTGHVLDNRGSVPGKDNTGQSVYLVPRLRIYGAIPPPAYTMTWCLNTEATLPFYVVNGISII
jgi:hypothetical protein